MNERKDRHRTWGSPANGIDGEVKSSYLRQEGRDNRNYLDFGSDRQVRRRSTEWPSIMGVPDGARTLLDLFAADPGVGGFAACVVCDAGLSAAPEVLLCLALVHSCRPPVEYAPGASVVTAVHSCYFVDAGFAGNFSLCCYCIMADCEDITLLLFGVLEGITPLLMAPVGTSP
ncbi:hypothetical protein Nepgr_026555 [Nepenthes gracilis]|uniref:Uncharacterized protein n=1 Tax=Nepenthes gracilis TaxID=150966 RepID=A0AAD3T8G4_NEPGR|nr:hypothetical protein Nepgr_026555 [Nepenthes gracilis]